MHLSYIYKKRERNLQMSKTFFEVAKESFSPFVNRIKDHKKIVIPIVAIVGVLIVSLVGLNIYKKLTTSPVPALIQANFGNTATNLASAQKLYVSAMVKDGQDKYLKIEAEDRRDSDTDHIKAAYSTSKTIIDWDFPQINSGTANNETKSAGESETGSKENIEETENIEDVENIENQDEESGSENDEETEENDEEIEENESESESEDEDEDKNEDKNTGVSDDDSEETNAYVAELAGSSEARNYDWELYVNTIDLKYGVYQRIKDGPWTLTKKSKTISEDDARTNYVEKNNEVSFDIIDDNIITDVNYSYDKTNNEYTVTGKSTYLVALSMMGNLRQILYECPLYSYTDPFFNEYNSKVPVDVKMIFDKTTKQLKRIDISVNDERLQECLIEYNSKKSDKYKISLSKVVFSIENTSFAESDIYVPVEIEKNAIIIR